MKFEKIININNILLRIKSLNKQLDYDITKILLINLNITNKLLNTQNIKLNNLTIQYGIIDGFDYVIREPEKKEAYEAAYKAILDEEVDIESLGFTFLSERDLRSSKLDIETLELLSMLFVMPNN